MTKCYVCCYLTSPFPEQSTVLRNTKPPADTGTCVQYVFPYKFYNNLLILINIKCVFVNNKKKTKQPFIQIRRK
jgi:hypothetical protein